MNVCRYRINCKESNILSILLNVLCVFRAGFLMAHSISFLLFLPRSIKVLSVTTGRTSHNQVFSKFFLQIFILKLNPYHIKLC